MPKAKPKKTSKKSKVVTSNGTVQRLRQARAEIKQLKAELETLRGGHSEAQVEMPPSEAVPSEHPPGHPPVADAAAE